MSKRTLMMVVALVAALAMAATGTLAYLTDTDSDVNVMTLGNVDIEQIELERGNNVADDATLVDGSLTSFVQGQPLFPAYAADDTAYDPQTGELVWGEFVTADEEATSHLWDDDKLTGALDKFVFVENTGESDAYVRTVFAFEAPADVEELLHFNTNEDLIWEKHGYITVEGVLCKLVSAVYPEALPAGKISVPSLLQVALDHTATNEDVEKLGETYNIYVISQAVQTVNLEQLGAKEALDAAFGVLSEDSHPWMASGEEGAQPPFESEPDTPVLVDDVVELGKALKDGKSVVLMDDILVNPASTSNSYGITGLAQVNGGVISGNGKTITIKGAGGTWDSGINTTGGIIQDLKVTGSFRGIFINHNSEHAERVILNDVVIDGTVYTISCDQGMNQGLTATDCTFNGWTSYAATLGDAIFYDCSFGEGSGYAYCRPYAPTQFINCDFEAGFTVDPVADIVMENCRLDGVEITGANLDQLVTDTSKVTIK
ncbi:MAG: SipW-dependent-type signal peptide-containing protein [Clostridia bacterium]|nr:SipW-dependent-type signal peptide-containing protein [Clostridia bacterium]